MNIQTNKKIVAAFDFDKTLTYHDMFFPFLIFVKGKMRTAFSLLFALPYLFKANKNPRFRQLVKEAVISHTIGGMKKDEIKQKGKEFIENMKKGLRPEALQRLLWHQQQGHHCVLVSAGLDVFLEPWAKDAGFQDLICSQLDVIADNTLSGKLVGVNCWGAEKTRRLIHLLGSKEDFILYAYGDSQGDKELLELADYPFYRTFK